MHIKPNKTITVMAGFGFGSYAWLKDDAEESDYVGVNIANLKTGMTDFKFSKQLEADFAKWIERFEKDALDNPDFSWSSLNEEGISLSHRLKEEVGNAANVLYVKPFEDRQHQTDEKTWIYPI